MRTKTQNYYVLFYLFIYMDCIGYIPTTPICLVDLRFDLFCCTSCRWPYSHLMHKLLRIIIIVIKIEVGKEMLMNIVFSDPSLLNYVFSKKWTFFGILNFKKSLQ